MSGKLKIAHVVCRTPPYEGGMGTVAVHLVEELRKNGHDGVLFSLNENMMSAFQWGNGGFVPQLFWKLRSYDIVHLHYPFYGAAESIFLAKIFRVIKGKLVLHYHIDAAQIGLRGYFIQFYEAVFLPLFVRLSDCVIVLSGSFYESCRLKKYEELMGNKVVFLPNGVDQNVFSPHAKDRYLQNKLGIREHSQVVVFIGALDGAHYFKGVEDLINAFRIAREQEQRLFLLVVGGGEWKKKFETMSYQLLPSESFSFTGVIPQHEVSHYLSLGDFLILPSYEVESFGIVLIESLAMGKSVIASDLPSLREVVKDETIGLTFRRRDVQDLADKILEMSRSTSRTEPTAIAYRRQYVIEKYSWEKIVKSLEEIYQRIL